MSEVNHDDRQLAIPPIDRRDPTALHEQVAATIRRAIADGEAGPGDRIPQVRDLAEVLGVNKNTVLRALRLLRDEGLLEMGRGRAIRVTGKPEHGAITTKIKDLLDLSRHNGYGRDELIAMIRRMP
jgi:GntR family transcriptional regulator